MRKVISIALLAAGLLAVACTKEDDRSVKEVVLDKTDTSVVKGHDVQLTARVIPENALEKTIAWSSDNKSVAVVDQTGLVKALTVGSANITAEAAARKPSAASPSQPFLSSRLSSRTQMTRLARP